MCAPLGVELGGSVAGIVWALGGATDESDRPWRAGLYGEDIGLIV